MGQTKKIFNKFLVHKCSRGGEEGMAYLSLAKNLGGMVGVKENFFKLSSDL